MRKFLPLSCLMVSIVLYGNFASGSSRSISAGRSEITVSKAKSGITVFRVRDKFTGKNILEKQDGPLFTANLSRVTKFPETESLLIDALNGWRTTRLSRTRSGLRLFWGNHENPALKGVSVNVYLTSKPADNALIWDIAINTKKTPWSVINVVFPNVSVCKFGKKCKTFIPLSCGYVVNLSDGKELAQRNIYPGAISMQYYAVYDESGTGFYFGVQDASASLKSMSANSSAGSDEIGLTVDVTCPNFTAPGNSYDSRKLGPYVWRIYRGDWYEAALIYKQWADTAPWSRNKKPRNKILDSINVWTRPYWEKGNPTEQDLIKLSEELDTPIGYHMYQWFSCPWDNDYPHYFPVKDGAKELVTKLKKHRIYSMPYINGRLWDTRDKDYHDFEFTKKAKPNTCKFNLAGDYFEEIYGALEKDKSKVVFAIMCPASEFWQEKLSGVAKRLVDDTGTDGVYFDQIAAAPPAACTSADHGHLPGAGGWWRLGYGKLISRVREKIPSDRFLVSEMNSEAYLDMFDGFLTWQWIEDNLVPAFPVVYGNKAVLMGCSYALQQDNEVTYNTKLGQQLVFGTQIGWFENLDALSVCKPFLKRVVAARKEISDYIQKGQMLRPPAVTGKIPVLEADWEHWGQKSIVHMPAVRTAIWVYENKACMVLVNVSKQDVECEFDANQYHACDKDVSFVKNESECKLDIDPVGRKWDISMKPLSVVVLKLSGKP